LFKETIYLKIFYATLVIIAAVFLILLPVTDGVYDFRTDIKEDVYNSQATAVGITSDNVTLIKPLYNSDISTVAISSNLTSDTPVPAGYHASTKLLDISGLAANSTRTLIVAYDFDAISGWASMNGVMDKLPWLWLMLIILFPVAAIVAIFVNKA
jgi:hypothetical protein